MENSSNSNVFISVVGTCIPLYDRTAIVHAAGEISFCLQTVKFFHSCKLSLGNILAAAECCFLKE